MTALLSQRMSPYTAAILLLAAALAWPAPSHAQIVDHFGVKAGIVSASASGDFGEGISDDQFGRRNGLAASVFAEKRVLPFFSVVGEVGYAQRGFVEKLDHYVERGRIVTDASAEARTRLHYLTVPLNVKLSYDLSPATLYALAGPRVDVLLDRDVGWFRCFESSPPFCGRFKSSLARLYASTAVGGTLGVGVATESWSPVRVLLEMRYDFDATESDGHDLHVRNNALSIVAGFAF